MVPSHCPRSVDSFRPPSSVQQGQARKCNGEKDLGQGPRRAKRLSQDTGRELASLWPFDSLLRVSYSPWRCPMGIKSWHQRQLGAGGS
jgi:hypothetical protein